MKLFAAKSIAFCPAAAGRADTAVLRTQSDLGVRGHVRALELGDPAAAGPSSKAVTCHRTPNSVPPFRRAFSLIEIMMVVTLLTLIMVALMSVFSSTQTAFRASITQTDILEGARAAMDIMTGDFRQLTPSGGNNATNPPYYSNGIYGPPPLWNLPPSNLNPPSAPMNLWVSTNFTTIVQPLVGASNQQMRTNQVQSVFLLTYENQLWRGIGYFVDTNSTTYIDPLYRYDSNLEIAMTNLPARPSPVQIFTNFCSVVATYPNLDPGTNATRVLNGVLQFTVRAFDPSGVWLTNGYTLNQSMPIRNAMFYPPSGGPAPGVPGEMSFYMSSNTLPAAVEIEMGVVEDRTLQRASTFPSQSASQSNYLAQQVGKVHVFRQRVTIPNFDPIAYQP